MPSSVIIAAVASAVGTAVASSAIAASVIASISFVTYAGIAAVTSFVVSSTLNNALRGGAKGGSGGGGAPTSAPAAAQARMQMIRSPAAPRQTIYGEVMASGALVFAASSDDNNTLHLVIAVAGHEVEDISTFYLNDKPVGTLDGNGDAITGDFVKTSRIATTESKSGASFVLSHTPINLSISRQHILTTIEVPYTLSGSTVTLIDFAGDVTCNYEYTTTASLVRFKTHLGAANQTADTDLVAANVGWTTAHRLQGIAYVYVRLTYDQTVFPTGIPNVRAVVKGKKLYDPRTTLTAYSNNSALIVYDYLTSRYQATAAEIDAASFIAAANICDEAVALAAGGTESRYTGNGVILSDVNHREAMALILSSCGGVLTTPQGVYRLNVAAYEAPVMALDEDILRAPMRVRAAVSKKDLYNAVKGQFVNPNNYWQGSDFPALTNSTYATEDGAQIFVDMQLQFTTSSTMAQRLAKIALEKSRQGITVDLPCKLSAIKVRPYENITLTIDHLGWSAKVFKVLAFKASADGGVDLTLQEEASACYTWSAEETAYDLAPNTNLPDPFTIGMAGNLQMTETLYETTGSAGVKAKATLTWDAPADAFVVDYEVEYKLWSDYIWTEIFNVRGTQYEFYDLAPETYHFRVKARNILGVVGEYTAPFTFTVYGLTAPPSDITGFTVKPMSGMALANWDRTTDLDVKIGGDVVIKWSPLTTGATWSDGVVLPDGEYNGDATSAIVPLATGTYMAKFKDSTGHYSMNAASMAVQEAVVSTGGWTTVATTTQHPTFAGAKTGIFFSSTAVAIELDGATLIDDWGLIDDQSYIDSVGGIISTGTYEFDAIMDCGSIAARRFHAHIKAQAYLDNDLIDDHLELIDTWTDIDGGALDDETATVFASASDDGIIYRPWVPFLVADFYGRYIKFKAVLESGDVTHNVHVYELSVTAKIPA